MVYCGYSRLADRLIDRLRDTVDIWDTVDSIIDFPTHLSHIQGQERDPPVHLLMTQTQWDATPHVLLQLVSTVGLRWEYGRERDYGGSTIVGHPQNRYGRSFDHP